ncbi:MAG TPA: hypothetical protein VKA87_06300 [Nitrososphaeraceae archaeon]|nr:hypothetical protein [Nitrososphaeraceae archaeon]
MATWIVLSGALAAPSLSTIPATYTTGGDDDDDHDDGGNGGDDDGKVTICHIPPGNPDNAHTIRVSENAVDAHLAHGDTLGECKEKY